MLATTGDDFMVQDDAFILDTAASYQAWVECCCVGGDDPTGDCSGNCVCGPSQTLINCDDHSPRTIHYNISADIDCGGNCGIIITQGDYTIPRVPAASQDPCCNYQTATPTLSCCDCTTDMLSSASARFEFSCERDPNTNDCVVVGRLYLCGAVYIKYDWDFSADSGTPNVMDLVTKGITGACCSYPSIINAWGTTP